MPRIKIISVITLLAIASWQFGEGAYIHLKAQLAQYLLQQSWQLTLHGQRQVKPWPWADTWPVARLQMPERDIDLIVLAGDTGRTLAFGPGHRFGTADIGALGSAMISAHRDTHFAFLRHIGKGDTLTVQTDDGQTHDYRIIHIEIIDSRNARLPSADDRSLLTLVTCYPFDTIVPGGPLRFVIVADKTEVTRSPKVGEII